MWIDGPKVRPVLQLAQDEHQPVDHLPLIHRTLVAATLGGRDQRADDRSLVLRQIARTAQLAAIIPGAVFVRPHQAAPANRAAAMESQVTPKIQGVPGWTLKCGPSYGLLF
jgi:hypothetical protein